MEKILINVAWLSVLLAMLACSPVIVKHTKSAPGFRLGNYETFGFYISEDTPDASRADAYHPKFEYLKGALINKLENRGLRYSATNPDLMVNPGIVVVEKVQTREADFMTDRPRYMGQQRYHWSSGEIEVGRYKEGTISIHLVDPKKNEMLWQGEVEATVPDKNKKLQRRISKGVQELMEKVPQ